MIINKNLLFSKVQFHFKHILSDFADDLKQQFKLSDHEVLIWLFKLKPQIDSVVKTFLENWIVCFQTNSTATMAMKMAKTFWTNFIIKLEANQALNPIIAHDKLQIKFCEKTDEMLKKIFSEMFPIN